MYRWLSSSSWGKKTELVGLNFTACNYWKTDTLFFKFKVHYLALDLFLDKVILSLVIEDDMDFLGAVAADVRAWDRNCGIMSCSCHCDPSVIYLFFHITYRTWGSMRILRASLSGPSQSGTLLRSRHHSRFSAHAWLWTEWQGASPRCWRAQIGQRKHRNEHPGWSEDLKQKVTKWLGATHYFLWLCIKGKGGGGGKQTNLWHYVPRILRAHLASSVSGSMTT